MTQHWLPGTCENWGQGYQVFKFVYEITMFSVLAATL